MLHLPDAGFRVYEVALYNTKVRDLVNRKRHHSYFDNTWAKLQVRDVVARDESEARELIAERFPPEEGFIVKRVVPSRH